MKTKISEFFSTIYGLSLFTIKSLYIIISEDMKKEASQTYKEEREEQKRIATRKRAKDASP
jgi:hypothetical protein